jgi:hypothetical protein
MVKYVRIEPPLLPLKLPARSLPDHAGITEPNGPMSLEQELAPRQADLYLKGVAAVCPS